MGGQVEICDYVNTDGVRVRKMATVHGDGFIFIDEARDRDDRRVGSGQIVLNPQEAETFLQGLLKLKEA